MGWRRGCRLDWSPKLDRCKAYTSKKERGYTLNPYLGKNDTSYEDVEGRDGRTKQRHFIGSL